VGSCYFGSRRKAIRFLKSERKHIRGVRV
jgi:hypothetical protein